MFCSTATQRLVLVGDRFALEHSRRDALLELPAQRSILAYQQSFRRWDDTQHHGYRGRRFLVSGRQPLGAPFQDALYDSRLPAGWHGSLARYYRSAEVEITEPGGKMRGHTALTRSSRTISRAACATL
jgi:hypothetical protein